MLHDRQIDPYVFPITGNGFKGLGPSRTAGKHAKMDGGSEAIWISRLAEKLLGPLWIIGRVFLPLLATPAKGPQAVERLVQGGEAVVKIIHDSALIDG